MSPSYVRFHSTFVIKIQPAFKFACKFYAVMKRKVITQAKLVEMVFYTSLSISFFGYISVKVRLKRAF